MLNSIEEVMDEMKQACFCFPCLLEFLCDEDLNWMSWWSLSAVVMMMMDDAASCEEGGCPEEIPILPPPLSRSHAQLTQEEKKFLLSVERGDLATVRRSVYYHSIPVQGDSKVLSMFLDRTYCLNESKIQYRKHENLKNF